MYSKLVTPCSVGSVAIIVARREGKHLLALFVALPLSLYDDYEGMRQPVFQSTEKGHRTDKACTDVPPDLSST